MTFTSRGALLLLTSCAAWRADGAEFRLIHETIVSRSESVARAAVADFDGDGRDDIAFLTRPGPVLTVVGQDATGTARIKQTLRLAPPAEPLSVFGLGQRVDAARAPLLLVTIGSDVLEFSGWPLAQQRRLPGLGSGQTVLVADLDADGRDELLRTARQNGVAVHDHESLAYRWGLPQYAEEARALQLDADPALEVVVSSVPGIVVDGATRAVEFARGNGFGALEPVLGQGVSAGFLAYTWSDAQLYRSAPLREVRAFTLSASPLAAVDVDGDGNDELVTPSGAGALELRDIDSGVLRDVLLTTTSYASSPVGADLDGAGGEEIVVRSNGSPDLFSVATLAPMPPRTFLPRGSGRHGAVARADIDHDGREEWLLGVNYAPVELRDAASDALLWRWPQTDDNSADDLWTRQRVSLQNIDDDAQLEIVLLGEDRYGARLMVFDGLTHALQLDWKRPLETYDHVAVNRIAQYLERVDADGDGEPEWLLALGGKGNVGAKLLLMSPEGEIAWESVGMGSGVGAPDAANAILRLALLQTDADAPLEWVVVMRNGLRAFDPASRLIDWNLSVSVEDAVAIEGPDGPELLVAYAGQANFLDPMTREWKHGQTIVANVRALAALPGGERRFVVAAGHALHAYDGRYGEIAAAENAGFYIANESRQLAIAHAGGDAWNVLVGDSVGYRDLRLLRVDGVFHDGFDP